MKSLTLVSDKANKRASFSTKDGKGEKAGSPPLITVITLSYQSPDLFRAIGSVMEQTYPRIEYFVIDDCSGNFSVEKTESFVSLKKRKNIERVQIIRNERNRGTVFSANLALRLARGEFVFFLAGDDEFHDSRVIEDWTEEFLSTGAKVITAYREVYDDKLEKKIVRLPDRMQVKAIRHAPPQKLFEKLAAENFIFGCCTAYQLSFIQSLGCFDPSYRLIEDWPFILKVLRQGEKICFFDRSVVKHRGGGTSSADRINDFYQNENRKIMEQESLPYSRHPWLLKKRYRAWEREKKQRNEFERRLARNSEHTVRKVLTYGWFSF